jgi:hypothetical protein
VVVRGEGSGLVGVMVVGGEGAGSGFVVIGGKGVQGQVVVMVGHERAGRHCCHVVVVGQLLLLLWVRG